MGIMTEKLEWKAENDCGSYSAPQISAEDQAIKGLESLINKLSDEYDKRIDSIRKQIEEIVKSKGK